MITQQDVLGIESTAQSILDAIDQMSDEEADSFITEWLKRTGALDEAGNEKPQIVKGYCFGW